MGKHVVLVLKNPMQTNSTLPAKLLEKHDPIRPAVNSALFGHNHPQINAIIVKKRANFNPSAHYC